MVTTTPTQNASPAQAEKPFYQFAVFDPRVNNLQAAATNEAIFALGPVLGIEVTVPELAARCTLGNIDPQHAGKNSNRAAIDEAWSLKELPPQGTVLATVRPDLDSVGVMALLNIWATDMVAGERPLHQRDDCGPGDYCLCGGVDQQIASSSGKVAKADKFAHGPWSPKELPTTENPWPSGEESRLGAIAAAIGDFKLPIAQRVAMMERWLASGCIEPPEYRAKVDAERLDMIAALETGAIKHELRANGGIAVVTSTHRATTTIGYSLAPVVVAANPAFKLGPGEPHLKYTVCQYKTGHVDLEEALKELATLEAGWGGSPTIIGSPQGVGSVLTLDQVVEMVERHLVSGA